MFQKVNHRVMLATITLLAFAEAVPVVKPSPSQSPQKLKGKFQPTKQTWKGMQGSKSADLQDEPKEPTDFLETAAAGNELLGREAHLDQRERELHMRERLLAEREEMFMQEHLRVKDELIAMLQERLKDKEHAAALEMRYLALLEQRAHGAVAPRKVRDLHHSSGQQEVIPEAPLMFNAADVLFKPWPGHKGSPQSNHSSGSAVIPSSGSLLLPRGADVASESDQMPVLAQMGSGCPDEDGRVTFAREWIRKAVTSKVNPSERPTLLAEDQATWKECFSMKGCTDPSGNAASFNYKCEWCPSGQAKGTNTCATSEGCIREWTGCLIAGCVGGWFPDGGCQAS